jgi:hypothetical protein
MSKRAVLDRALNYLYLAEELIDNSKYTDGMPWSLVEAITELEGMVYEAAMEEQADKAA